MPISHIAARRKMHLNQALKGAWVAVAVAVAFAPLVFGQATPTVKQAPPPGIEVPSAEADALKSKLDELGSKIKGLESEHLADVEVFHKAVRYALDYNEFFKPAEITQAREQLEIGLRRAEELKRGGTPSWLSARGPSVRGYRSRIDGSVQPYGLIVPEDWKGGEKKDRPLYLWFHGRNDTLSEVVFIAGQLKAKREFAPVNAFELHLYGRYCNASKFAGEIDAFEAMEDVMRHYAIDTNRIAALGFSMGGATAWHIAAHYPGMWAVASAGAGFAETAQYAKVFNNKKDLPTPWEQTLWHLYDATDYAANFANLPMIAYSGEIDPQKQSADIMEKAMAAEDLKLERLIGPNTAHKYEAETKKELSRRIDVYMEKGCDPEPADVRFVTYTLRYNRMKWITLDELEKHWQRAEIRARVESDSIRVQTTNIAAFTIGIEKPEVVIDGQKIRGNKSFRKVEGKWQPETPQTGLYKGHGLSGPIDDAFMDSFVFVRPTGAAFNEKVRDWTENEFNRAITEWRRNFRGDALVKNDDAITDDDIARHNLVLWGDPGSNRLLQRILPDLPLSWTKDELRLAMNTASATDHAPVFIFPNPLNPKRYVVINSSFTFRQGSTTSNSLQTPKLPDWALVDLRTPASLKWPGKIESAGFFDDQWRLDSK